MKDSGKSFIDLHSIEARSAYGMTDRDYIRSTPKSRRIYRRACKVFPAGVTYRIRHFHPYPFFVRYAKASKLFDIDGNKYTDYWCAHFSLILGHSHPAVVRALQDQAEKGYHFGVAHELELDLAEQIVRMVPSAEMVRFTSTGTEANMYSIRLARTYTKRVKIGKFEGNWHGGYDSLHVAVKPPLDQPQSGGLAENALRDTVVLPYNDLEAVRKIVKDVEFASITVEPIMGVGGFIPAERDFLKGLREICDEKGCILIFDEVITGFRVGAGCAQETYGVKPDLTVLGKIAGGGLPIGVLTGRTEVMEHIDHLKYAGNDLSFHGGTHTGNPMSMAAGLTTLKLLERGKVYRHIGELGNKLRRGLQEAFETKGVPAQVTGVGSLFGCHFTAEKPVKDIRAASRANKEIASMFHQYLLDRGIFLLTPELIHGAISDAHTRGDIDCFLTTAESFADSIR